MTIEERLDKLTERHEALTQTAELMAAESRKHTDQIGQITAYLAQIGEGIARLLHVAEIHEQRIERLEE